MHEELADIAARAATGVAGMIAVVGTALELRRPRARRVVQDGHENDVGFGGPLHRRVPTAVPVEVADDGEERERLAGGPQVLANIGAEFTAPKGREARHDPHQHVVHRDRQPEDERVTQITG